MGVPSGRLICRPKVEGSTCKGMELKLRHLDDVENDRRAFLFRLGLHANIVKAAGSPQMVDIGLDGGSVEDLAHLCL